MSTIIDKRKEVGEREEIQKCRANLHFNFKFESCKAFSMPLPYPDIGMISSVCIVLHGGAMSAVP
jgi:hypothetical protein